MKSYIIFLFLLLISFPVMAQQKSSVDSSNYIIQDSVRIKNRDGASIFATIVRKKGITRPLPAILFFTTYYGGAGDASFAQTSAEHDYVGIVAYSRGIRTNIKNYVPYEHDGRDADDVIDWISKQPWCNGKVGMYEGSYTGFVQWAAVKSIPDALKTIVPQAAVMPGFDTPMENNIFSSSLAFGWANNILGYPPLSPNIYAEWYERGIAYRALDSLAGYSNRIFQKWLQHPAYDDYWKSMVPTPDEYANLKIPILTTTGYYDGDQLGNLQYVKEYLKYNKNPDLYLVIGPYDHYGSRRKPKPVLMRYHIDPVANVDMKELVYQWFDYTLKDGDKPAILKDRLNFEVMGANKWRHVPSFNKMNNDTLTFFLSSRKKDQYYLLESKKSGGSHYLKQTVDFKDRSIQNNYYTPYIINDTLDASHGLIFMTEPFKNKISINGSFSGKITASINKKDMDISIAFYELMPNGEYFYLTRYLGRASYARNLSKRELLTPYRKETIPLADTRMISKQLDKGSRLVMVLNINKHPYEEINYGTGRDVSGESIKDAGVPLQVKWYNDSFISIPVWRTKL